MILHTQETVGIILGRSGLTSQGFIVHPGVVDGDSKEEIKIIAYVKKEMQIDAGDRIAQLLLFPYIKIKATPVERTGAFRSFGKCVFWQRLQLTVQMMLTWKLWWILELWII